MRTVNIGTQEIGLGDVVEMRCRCRRKLVWKDNDEDGTSYRAECPCGMVYVASEPLVRIEGREDERT